VILTEVLRIHQILVGRKEIFTLPRSREERKGVGVGGKEARGGGKCSKGTKGNIVFETQRLSAWWPNVHPVSPFLLLQLFCGLVGVSSVCLKSFSVLS
jgi:hypothetical protein